MKRILIPAAVLFIASLAGCQNPATDKPSTAAPSLSDYKITEVGARSTAAAQPYGTAIASALPRKQIYFDGVSYNSSANPRLVDYKGNAPGVLFTGSNSAWSANPHASTPARIAVSGKQSILSVVFTPKTSPYTTGANQGNVSLVVWDGTTQTVKTPFKDSAAETFSLYLSAWGGNWYYQTNNEISVAAGDITGDGKDEIGFCVGNRFVILDSDLATILYDGWATGTGSADTDTSTMHPSRVAAGDIKGDGNIEFIVTYGSAKTGTVGSYKIFGGSSPSVIDDASLAGNGCPLSLLYANVALGDLDGDGKQEVLFAGREDLAANACGLVAARWDSASSKLVFLANGFTIPVAGGDWAYNPVPPLLAFDPDGKTNNPRDIVLAWDTIVAYDAAAKTFSQGYKGLSTIPRPVYTNVASGDVNCDNQDELISLSSAGGVGFEVYSLGTGNSFSKTTITAAVGSYMSLCAADLAGNSLVLQYLGTSVRYSNPQLIAVLASPPYYADAASNPAFGNAGTSFGSTAGSTTGSSNSFTVSASFTIGVQGDAPLWGDVLAETDKLTVGSSFTYAFEQEKEISCSHIYTTMAGQDSVVYSCIPFDVYTYKILAAPNAEAVGKTMTVDFPREPQTVMMDREGFNSLPSNPLSVGSSILSHSLGSPRSYPNKAAITAACSAGGIYDPSGMTSPVGGSGHETSTVCISQSKGTKVGGGLSVTASVEFVILGALFGAETGFSTDFDYTVTTSNSTELSGTVPGINATDSPFDFGIAGYNLTDTKLQANPFMVVTYWVQ